MMAIFSSFMRNFSMSLTITSLDISRCRAQCASLQDGGENVFHAGTKATSAAAVTSGGRVLAVTAVLTGHRRRLCALDKMHFDGMHYRSSVAHSPHDTTVLRLAVLR
jgi:hypothetical protein